MSTERGGDEERPAASSRASGTGRRWRRYQRTSLATIAVLAVASAALGVAAVARGPKLDTISVNPAAAISRDGQKLVLHADQPIGEVSSEQVSITPSTAFDVTSSGNDVTVSFPGLLDYATDYRVRVEGVVSASTGLTGALDAAFETPDVPVYTLLRQGGAAARDPGQPEDQVLRSGLAAGAEARSDVVFQAPHIAEYAVTDLALAAVVADDDGRASLRIAPDGAAPFTVHTPTGARLQHLKASPTARLFGFSVNGGADASGREYQNTVFVFDPLSPSGRAEEVTGFGGAPLQLVAWDFVPGTSSLVAQGTDQQLYLIDPLSGGDPTPLGRHVEMRGFLPGERQLVVADGESVSTIDLSSGAVVALPQSQPAVDPAYYPKKIVTLGDGVTIRQFDDVDYASASPVVGSVILQADGAGTRELYRSTTPGSRVRDFCVSPNGQYLAVETIPAGSVNDGYALSAYSGMTTYFVDIGDGTIRRGVPGFLPDWCT
jgi:hypothetical protein